MSVPELKKKLKSWKARRYNQITIETLLFVNALFLGERSIDGEEAGSLGKSHR